MTYHIGQTVPLDYAPAFFVPCDPAWFIMLSSPGSEKKLAEKLRRQGALDVWRPVDQKWRVAKGSRDKVPYEVSVAPGYVFMLVDKHPQWHVIRQKCQGLARGVVVRDGQPHRVSSQDLAEMAQCPDRIEDMRQAAEAQRAAERAAKAPRQGDTAKIMEGPLAGFSVPIETINAGIAYFVLGGVKASARVEAMERQDTKA